MRRIVMTPNRSGILLVEDDANDEFLTCRVLRKEAHLNDVTVARDGAEALDYLFARGAYAGRDVQDLPLVILLDLNLPKIGGLDVLKAIRADERTRLVPVVIMSSSSEEGDRLIGYQNGANSYVVKPVLVDQFSEVVKQLGLYWLVVNALPTNRP
jgi:two-component system, response regulator